MTQRLDSLRFRLQGGYINLAASAERRAHMQAQLDRLGMAWIQRFEAIPAARNEGRPPQLADAERACARSHADLIEQLAAAASTTDTPTFSLVLEDDALLSDALPDVLARSELLVQLQAYDLVFLECQPDIGTPSLTALWASRQRRMDPAGCVPRRLLGVDILDARGLYRWGAVAYLLTPRGAPLLQALARGAAGGAGCLQGPAAIGADAHAPWDLRLRQWMEAGHLRAAVLSPFLATARLDSLASSTIAGPREVLPVAERLGAAMRALFFAGGCDAQAFAGSARHAALTDDPELRLLADLAAQLFIVNVQGAAAGGSG